MERYVTGTSDLWAGARVSNFLPVLVERSARQRLGDLAVVTSQVADTADGRTADGSVVAMMVVEMQPVSKRSGSLAV